MALLMVNLVWAVHRTVAFLDPHDLPLTLGVVLPYAMSILVLATRRPAKIQVAVT